MKNEKGITLLTLCVYMITVVIVIGTLATLNQYFLKNYSTMNKAGKNAAQFNKFNLAFVTDNIKKGIYVKNISNNEIEFSDGTKYTYKSNKILRNEKICAKDVTVCQFSKDQTRKKYNCKNSNRKRSSIFQNNEICINARSNINALRVQKIPIL